MMAVHEDLQLADLVRFMHRLIDDKQITQVLSVAPALLWIVTSKINTKFGVRYANEPIAVKPREINR